MDKLGNIEWFLDCDPRPVQLEALRRSFYGHKLLDGRDADPRLELIRNGPARAWGHFLEMRLGKTPTAINEWLLFEQHHGVKRLVVFTPNSYKYTWAHEFEKFGVIHPAEPITLGRYLVPQRDKLSKVSDPIALIVNYEAMQHKHAVEAVMEFVKGAPCGMVFDESIKLKNPESIQTKNCRDVAKFAAYTRPMSGRPMTQGPQDLYSQLRLCGLLEGKNFYAFRNRFCKMGGFKAKKVVGVQNEQELYDLMDRGSMIGKRMHWADVVEAEYAIDEFDSNDEQKKHYNTMAKEYYTMVEDEVIDVDQVITQWMKMQQIASGFVYDEHKKEHWLCPPKDNAKLQRLLQVLEETDSKVVVLFHYKPSGELLREQLKRYNPAFIYSKQWMAKERRDYDGEKNRFNSDPSCRVCIGQLDATKYGHDLTGAPGDRTRVMVFYENTISLDTRGQVEARVTASAQDWEVLYMDLISFDIERDFVKALIQKETLERMVLGSYGKERWK